MTGEFVIITGLAGAGGSSAANVLEDRGWFVIDNLPTTLIDKVAELASAPGSSIERVALVVRARADVHDLITAVDALRTKAARVRIVFLEASDEVLVRRYEDTRRRHPLSALDLDASRQGGIAGTVAQERLALQPIRELADVVVDTSDLNVHRLRERVLELFGEDSAATGMQTTILSFGYKHGLPLDVDLVIDCRFLPNPHWVDELRPLTGLDEPVRGYVLGFPQTTEFLERLDSLLELLLPAYVQEGKSYLTLALGCTGGRHRSVAVSEEVAKTLRAKGYEPRVRHRDRER